MFAASYYRREGKKFFCLLCPHRCRLQEGEAGRCGVRRVEDGKLWTFNYGTCVAAAFDPIEKKPLYHFHPGKEILSLGTFGCNFNCHFCQNWQLVRSGREDCYSLEPGEVLELLERQKPSRRLGVAYTYAEPAIWYEFVRETAALIAGKGYCNVLVSNGFISEEPLTELLPFIDAMNIDVKAFNAEFYRKWCGGNLDAVLNTVEKASEQSHIEVTYLVIPTLNDNEEEIRQFTQWLAAIDPSIPVHFSRYFPQNRMEFPPTPLQTLEKVRQIALENLQYVYLGNVGYSSAAHTYCPRCQTLLIRRGSYDTTIEGLQEENCRSCGQEIPVDL